MKRLFIGTGLLHRDVTLLLVCSRYPDEQQPLWTLPGGRQQPREMLAQTVAREFREETSLAVRVGELAYVSESIDERAKLHVVNCTFWVTEDERAKVMPHDPDVVDARFVPVDEALQLLRADVLKIPVGNALRRTSEVRYYAFAPDEIKVPFFSAGVRR